MHNIKELRKNLNNFKKKFLDRNTNFNINNFEELDNANRKLITEKEKLEQEKKHYLNQKMSQTLINLRQFQKKY